MDLLENIVVFKIFGSFILEFFDVGSSTECFFEFAQKNNDLNVRWLLELFDAWYQWFFHVVWKCIQILWTVHVDESDLIFNLWFTKFENVFIEERANAFSDDIHIFSAKGEIIILDRNGILIYYFDNDKICKVIFYLKSELMKLVNYNI